MTVERFVRNRILAWVTAAALAAVPAWGQSKTGTTMGQFLLIEPSARLAGMGNAGVSVTDVVDAVYFNPAVIGLLGGTALSFTHSAWLADITYDYAAAAFPVGKWGGAFASVTALNSGDIEVRTVTHPLGTGERYSVSAVAIGLGYGRQITDRFSAGVQVNYVQETIWHTSVSTMTLGIGTLFRTSERGLHVGASLSNFGTQGRFAGRDLRITYDNDPSRYGDNGTLPGEVFTDEFPVPVLFRVGIGVPEIRLDRQTRLRLALDASHPSDNTESVSAGAEVEYAKLLALRTGWQNAFQKDAEGGFTAGGGVRGNIDVYDCRVDYAWADHGRRLGGTHRVTLGVTF